MLSPPQCCFLAWMPQVLAPSGIRKPQSFWGLLGGWVLCGRVSPWLCLGRGDLGSVGMPLEATLLHTSALGDLDSAHPALGLSFPSNSQDPS